MDVRDLSSFLLEVVTSIYLFWFKEIINGQLVFWKEKLTRFCILFSLSENYSPVGSRDYCGNIFMILWICGFVDKAGWGRQHLIQIILHFSATPKLWSLTHKPGTECHPLLFNFRQFMSCFFRDLLQMAHKSINQSIQRHTGRLWFLLSSLV